MTTAGSHFKSGLSQWSEPWLSRDDSSSDRTFHSPLIVATLILIPETNLIVSDISCIFSIGWWGPVQCHRRFVWVYSCCQVLNWFRSESCMKKSYINLCCSMALPCSTKHFAIPENGVLTKDVIPVQWNCLCTGIFWCKIQNGLGNDLSSLSGRRLILAKFLHRHAHAYQCIPVRCSSNLHC